jgi:hypothetical protein
VLPGLPLDDAADDVLAAVPASKGWKPPMN